MNKEEMRLIVKKNDEYRRYIIKHIENVKKAWLNMKLSPKCRDVITLHRSGFTSLDIVNHNSINIAAFTRDGFEIIDGMINSHDLSKYSKEEFEPYRRFFYPINDKEKEDAKEDLEVAFKHHYENNLHHWNWWDESGNQEKMPMNFVIEMCCDWIAMSMIYTETNALEWYKKQVDVKLGYKQKALVENLLEVYYIDYKTDGSRK